MNRPDREHLLLITLTCVGLGDSAYLTIDSFAKVPPVCPTIGILDCGRVTQSQYSHPLGVPVALLGLLWFAVMLGLALLQPDFASYLMLPLWIAGVAMIGYLVFVELALLHAICIYCTLAHACTVLTIVPILRISFSEAEDG